MSRDKLTQAYDCLDDAVTCVMDHEETCQFTEVGTMCRSVAQDIQQLMGKVSAMRALAAVGPLSEEYMHHFMDSGDIYDVASCEASDTFIMESR